MGIEKNDEDSYENRYMEPMDESNEKAEDEENIKLVVEEDLKLEEKKAWKKI